MAQQPGRAMPSCAGLRPMGQRYVHLSAEADAAWSVGARHGPPVVLLVDAAALVQTGQPFYQAQN
ncbi:MAG: RNA 2'-phosphotransferase, partial [Pseudomonadota bacterium]